MKVLQRAKETFVVGCIKVKERNFFISQNASFVKDRKLFWNTVFSQINEIMVRIYNLLKVINTRSSKNC